MRASLAAYNAESVDIVRAFNLLLNVGSQRDELEQCDTIFDLAKLAGEEPEGLQAYSQASVRDAVYILLNASPPGVPPLDADLLVRHALGRLYQEAHFELERQSIIQMSLFGGRMPIASTRGEQQRDARFTPTELARTLVEQALSLKMEREELVVLDPACGCGVFLLEVLRELEARQYPKKIRLVGFDASPVSEVMARFCITRAVADSRRSGLRVDFELKRCDALATNWGRPDLILMNPPFASVNEMSEEERSAARAILGPAGYGKLDKSMAFMFKAADSLAIGGQMASVLPSTLFDSANGEPWRKAMMERVTIRLLGRFHGYGYFQGALVEPGFMVAASNRNGATPKANLTVLIANEGAEDAALRALRKGRKQIASPEHGVHLSFDYSADSVAPTGWMPRTFAHERILAALSNTPRVERLFDVQQGAHSGANDVFVITSDELNLLPRSEQKYFRPAAGTKTIRDGRLLKTQYVFFPYNESGLQLRTIDELTSSVPTYYALRLEPNKERLAKRASLVERGETKWWVLNRERKWQHERHPTLMSGYFGGRGGFAYDTTGEFVCVHGYAWFPLIKEYSPPEADPVDFHETDLPWAYVAILNSHPFEVLLSCFCSRVQGGQYNLSKHFVNNVPLPDLCREDVPADMVAELAKLGRIFSEGAPVNDEQLSQLIARAYGVQLNEWNLNE
jgi:hypothetical protein